MVPLSVVDKESFREMLRGFLENDEAVQIPSRKTLTKHMSEKMEKVKQKLKDTLMQQAHLCTTADIWSTNNKSYLGMTVHYINTSNLTRESFMLGCKRIKYSHTFSEIANDIYKMHNELGIDHSKVTHTITDNASNFGKAFRIYTKQLYIYDENNTEQIGQSSDNVVLNENDDESLSEDEVEIKCTEEQNTEVINLIIESENEDDILLPRQLCCLSHTLNLLAVNDANKVLTNAKTNESYKNIHSSSFKKANKLWSTISRSTKAADYVYDIIKCRLPVPNITRWNSYYVAVNKLLLHKNKMNEICEKLNLVKFKGSELIFFQEYVCLMEKLAEAINILQGEKNCYLGVVLPTLIILKQHLKTQYNFTFCKVLQDTLLENFEKRFAKFLDFENEISKECFVATVSHPKFKLTFLSTEEYRRSYQLAKELFLEHCKMFYKTTTVCTESDSDGNGSRSSGDTRTFFKSFSKNSSSTEVNEANIVSVEALSYLENKSTKLSLLDSYPTVKKVFLKYNTTLPSSAPVERIFSTGGQILTPRRNRLCDKTFEILLFLKHNMKSLLEPI